MNVAPGASVAPVSHLPSRARFVRHYLEMLAVMIVSMLVLSGLFWSVMAVLGHENLRHYIELRAFVMTTNMVIGMTLWMRFRRRHTWASTLEMDAAMILPLALLIGPYWTGLLSGGALLAAEHMLMLPLMFFAMLRRYDEYAGMHVTRDDAWAQSPQ